MSLEQFVAQCDDLAGSQRRRGIRVKQRRLVDVVAAAKQRRADGQLDDIEEGAIQRGELHGQVTDIQQARSRRPDVARSLDARVLRQVADPAAVAGIDVDLPLGAGLQRVDELRSELVGRLQLKPLARIELPGQLVKLPQVLLRPGQIVPDEDAEVLDLRVKARTQRSARSTRWGSSRTVGTAPPAPGAAAADLR